MAPTMSSTGLPTAMPTHSYDNSVLLRVGTRFWWPNQLMLADHVEATHDLEPLAWCCLVAGALILLHDLHLNRLRYSTVWCVSWSTSLRWDHCSWDSSLS